MGKSIESGKKSNGFSRDQSPAFQKMNLIRGDLMVDI
jgi:hypothetical protein